MEDIHDHLIFRKVTSQDYKAYQSIINDFRETTFTESQFQETLCYCDQYSDIMILEYKNRFIATATIVYEKKFIFNICTLAHIEDVCVTPEYRKYGLGKLMINKLVDMAKEKKCYKVTLDCADHNIDFYAKCNFEKRGNQMTIYFGN
jgi:glucosamine-phosphate N-acetyltransferase